MVVPKHHSSNTDRTLPVVSSAVEALHAGVVQERITGSWEEESEGNVDESWTSRRREGMT